MQYKKLAILGVSLLAGMTFSLAMPSYSYAKESPVASEAMVALPGVKEADLLKSLEVGGWKAVEGADHTYMKEGTQAKNEKSMERYFSYVAENGIVTQETSTFKTGNKGAAEKQYKEICKNMAVLLGRWTSDGLWSGDTIMGGKYTMWALPQQGAFCKVSWSRDNHKPFLKSDTTETVSIFFANYSNTGSQGHAHGTPRFTDGRCK